MKYCKPPSELSTSRKKQKRFAYGNRENDNLTSLNYSTESTEENRRLSAIASPQLELFGSKKEETPAFQFCSLQAEKDTELEVIATERGFRLHWQKEPIGIHLTHSEAIALAECLQPKIDDALAKGEGIDFKDQHWRQIHTSLLEKVLQEGGEG